jgi:hypothetical protein
MAELTDLEKKKTFAARMQVLNEEAVKEENLFREMLNEMLEKERRVLASSHKGSTSTFETVSQQSPVNPAKAIGQESTPNFYRLADEYDAFIGKLFSNLSAIGDPATQAAWRQVFTTALNRQNVTTGVAYANQMVAQQGGQPVHFNLIPKSATLSTIANSSSPSTSASQSSQAEPVNPSEGENPADPEIKETKASAPYDGYDSKPYDLTHGPQYSSGDQEEQEGYDGEEKEDDFSEVRDEKHFDNSQPKKIVNIEYDDTDELETNFIKGLRRMTDMANRGDESAVRTVYFVIYQKEPLLNAVRRTKNYDLCADSAQEVSFLIGKTTYQQFNAPTFKEICEASRKKGVFKEVKITPQVLDFVAANFPNI